MESLNIVIGYMPLCRHPIFPSLLHSHFTIVNFPFIRQLYVRLYSRNPPIVDSECTPTALLQICMNADFHFNCFLINCAKVRSFYMFNRLYATDKQISQNLFHNLKYIVEHLLIVKHNCTHHIHVFILILRWL